MPELALNLSRGCGNPTGFARIERGEAVVDFGCGGGIDVILAAHKVGPQGRVVGIDFTPQMIGRAKETVATSGLGDRNIELRLVNDMTQTKLADGEVDVVISNCVINLCPDKDAVYREAFRVLRPGGRVAISDVVLSWDLPTEPHARVRSTWAGCLGGAIPEDQYLETVRRAGFVDIQVVACHPFSPDELRAMSCCPGEAFTPVPSQDDLAAAQGKVTSIKFTAVKQASVGEAVAFPRESPAPPARTTEPGAPAEAALEIEGEPIAEPPEGTTHFVSSFTNSRAPAEQSEAEPEAAPAEPEGPAEQSAEPEAAPAEEPEGPAEELGEEPVAPAGAALGVRQLAESTATIAITLPPVGSIQVKWDFRAENSRR